MYTLIRHGDSRVTLRTHVDPVELSPDEAARLLRGLDPLLSTLAHRAASRHDSGHGAVPPERTGPGAAAPPARTEERALAS